MVGYRVTVQCLRKRVATQASLEVGEAVGRAPRGFGDRLLRKEASSRDHAEAGMGELFLLHLAELGGVLGGEAERVKAELTRHVAWTESGLSLELLAVELAEGDVDSGQLGFDPLGLAPEDPAEFREMQEKELAHARLAMVAAAIFLLQEAITKDTWGTAWGIPDF